MGEWKNKTRLGGIVLSLLQKLVLLSSQSSSQLSLVLTSDLRLIGRLSGD